LAPAYHDCGQFYWMRVDSFLKQKKIFAENTIPFVMQDFEVQDIDTPQDWVIAEFKYKYLESLKTKERGDVCNNL
jgi:pseudaminic acid cytidylyltransferase